MPRSNSDLHGNAPDSSPVALLVIDAINDLEFEGGSRMLGRAVRMARRIAALKRRDAERGIPTIYNTTLELLLDYLQMETVVVTGIATDVGVLFTAADAYMRDLRVVVPGDCATALTPAGHRAGSRRCEPR